MSLLINYQNIFVTGGLGFIGSNLCNYIITNSNSSVTIYDNFSNGSIEHLGVNKINPRINIINNDLLNLDALTQAIVGHDLVIHLAANADIAASAVDPKLDLNQTIIATFNVLEAMRKSSIFSIIYSSGSGVYGDVDYLETFEEYGPLYPVSMYGATKLSAEAMISSYANLFKIKAIIFRFANVVGPNQTHGVGYDFIKRLKNSPERLDVYGDGFQSKSYIHVEDIISAILVALENSSSNINTFNVGTSDYISVRSIVEIVLSEMKLSETKVEYGNTPFGWKGDVPIVRFSSSKIESIGWKRTYSSTEAMRKAVQQMLNISYS